MTLIRALCLVAALSAALSTCILAAPENEALKKGDDPRLDQSVAFDSGGVTIAQVLDQLSASTGVTMSAGQDQRDWMVRDRKVIVHVRDMPLRDLMQEVASVLRFQWSREGESGKWTYRIRQDKLQRDEEDSLRTSTEDALAKQSREKRENAISEMVNLGSLSAQDASALRGTDPWRYVLATQPLGRDIAEFVTTFPEARNAFVQGVEASFPVSALPAALQSTVRRIAQSYDELTRSIGISEDHSALLSRFDKLQITINRGIVSGRKDAFSKSLLGRITIGSMTESIDVPLFDPSSAMGKALGTAIVRLQSGVSKDQVAKDLQAALESAAKETSALEGPVRDITSDPALKTPIRLFEVAVGASLPMALQSLAINARMNVVSDYFIGPPVLVPAGQKPLGEQLEIIRTGFGTNWEKAGNRLRFRDREWFRKRAWEVPQEWVTYWTERGRRNDGLRLEDLVQIGCLRDEQLDHIVAEDAQLKSFGAGDAVRNRHILRFYGSLNAEQKKALQDGTLVASALDEAQWTAMREALATKGAAYAASQKGSQAIRLTVTTKDVTEYTFSYYPGAGEPTVTFLVASGVVNRPSTELPPLPPPVNTEPAP